MKKIIDWSAKRAGSNITITGTGETSPTPIKIVGVREIVCIGGTTVAIDVNKNTYHLVQATPTAENDVIAEIAAERRRQIDSEGWTPKHDDQNKWGQLAGAAACYSMHSLKIPNTSLAQQVILTTRDLWPFSRDWWKPTIRRRDLIKATALLVAEIERLDRAEVARGAKTDG